MNDTFRHVVEDLEPKFQALMTMTPVRYGALPGKMPERGIYLFSEGKRHLYVGRANGIRKRLAAHCRPGSGHSSATLAFLIARGVTGNLKATYKKEGSRAALMQEPAFKTTFVGAKARLAAMDVRFVEETDAVRQALLEIYVAVTLKTPFNDFENH